jgi:hypothetical protein
MAFASFLYRNVSFRNSSNSLRRFGLGLVEQKSRQSGNASLVDNRMPFMVDLQARLKLESEFGIWFHSGMGSR